MAKAKYKKGDDDYFCTRVWDGTYNEDGSKHRRTLRSRKSSADLEKQVNELKQQVKTGDVVRCSNYTFLEYSKQWRKTYKQIRESGTQNMYDNIISKHFTPLHNVSLTDIRKMHYQMIINNAKDKPRTCQQICVTFNQVIKSAVQDHLLPARAFNDVCAGIDVPPYNPPEKRPLYPEEVEAMKKANLSPMERTFVYIIYGCGLRRGEVLALNREFDIDLKKGTLSVRQAVEFNGNDPSFKDPKSKNGFRTIPMPGYLTDHLASYIPSIKSDYLMHKRNGQVMTKSSYDKMWERIRYKMNIAAGGSDDLKVIYGFTAHTFRHDFATNLCYQIPKISIRKIAQLMGDTEAVVLKIYNHIKEEKENAEEVINEARAL